MIWEWFGKLWELEFYVIDWGEAEWALADKSQLFLYGIGNVKTIPEQYWKPKIAYKSLKKYYMINTSESRWL